MKVLFDFETKSTLPIDVGAKKYLSAPGADIICMTYKIEKEPTKLWIPGDDLPFTFGEIDPFWYAYNIQFDRLVTHILGPKYGMKPVRLKQCIDVQAICARYALPQNLADACKILNVIVQKDPKGKKLMKLITQPPFKHTHEQLLDFYDYALTDVESMYHLINKLPLDHLSDQEQATWERTVQMNERGIPVDIHSIKRIYSVTTKYIDYKAMALPGLTAGKITKPTQTARMVKFANAHGIMINSVAKDILKATLERDDIPNVVREVLNIRRLLGLTSVAKYKKIISQEFNGRTYGNIQYYGAHTGREAGRGWNPYNQPRDSTSSEELYIEQFFNGDILDDNPVKRAKQLIRGMVKASDGHMIFSGDWSGIEMRLLDWVAGEHEELDMIRKGMDPYVRMASRLYRIDESEINDHERFFGKTLVLGAGYQLGAKGFQKYAGGYGIELDQTEAEEAIGLYRETHPAIKDLWKRVKQIAIAAIQRPGERFTYRGVSMRVVKDRTGRSWLCLALPSGRVLYYNTPDTADTDFGLAPTFYGQNPYSKKWGRIKMSPGRITENIIQALARDVLEHGKRQFIANGVTDIILSVYDEIVAEVRDRGEALNHKYCKQLINMMTITDDWCPDLPLDASGYIRKRYKKG